MSQKALLKHLNIKSNLQLTEVYRGKILFSFKGLWISPINVNVALHKSGG